MNKENKKQDLVQGYKLVPRKCARRACARTWRALRNSKKRHCSEYCERKALGINSFNPNFVPQKRFAALAYIKKWSKKVSPEVIANKLNEMRIRNYKGNKMTPELIRNVIAAENLKVFKVKELKVKCVWCGNRYVPTIKGCPLKDLHEVRK